MNLSIRKINSINPVLKISGNSQTQKCLSDHIDKVVQLSEKGADSLAQVGEDIYEEIKAIASGKKAKAEVLGYGQFSNIFIVGQTIFSPKNYPKKLVQTAR